MFISEIFYSIQGEGELAGVPSVFIRTSGCNLRCTWCDTKYASWKPEGTEVGLSEVLDQVAGFPAHHVVLTGGEPMVAPGMPELAAELRAQGRHITIETAATVAPNGIACDLASLSPKLANSAPDTEAAGAAWLEKHEARRIQPEVLGAWIDDYEFQLKFVVQDEGDIAEIDEVIQSTRRKVPPWKILLMPQGIESGALEKRSGALVDLCKARGYRYCNRLHIALFGNSKGT